VSGDRLTVAQPWGCVTMISLLFAAALLAAEPEPTTVAPAVATAPAKAAPKAKPDEVVCRREPVLGSRMKQRTCLTQAEWDARKNEARDAIERAQTNMPQPK